MRGILKMLVLVVGLAVVGMAGFAVDGPKSYSIRQKHHKKTGVLSEEWTVDEKGQVHEYRSFYRDGESLAVYILYEHGEWVLVKHFDENGNLTLCQDERGGLTALTGLF